MLNILKKIFGTKNERTLKRINEIVVRINELESSVAPLSDEDLQAKMITFKNEYANGRTLDNMLPEVFATVREASKRVLKMRHFDVQMVGGIVLHEGKIAEMRTGEGKTLTATLPLILNAVAGKGAHLITVNDYLAQRDSEWMGQVYSFLGMKTGLIVHGLNDFERKEAYACDITYGTNNEFGFDYLRDNMKTDLGRLVQRDHFYAIVDEVDSILIDEARTPLIISGPTDLNTDLYYTVNTAIPGLQKDSDYIVDEKSNTVALTEDGISKIEKRLKLDNLYDPRNIEYLHHVHQAMKAHILFKKDVDYVVRENKVVIVDEFTGRLMPGRRYSDGLHGALEAKEHLKVESENQTLATITFQNYFRIYDKLSGMTGTADTEAVEFQKIYNLDVVVIPPNRNMVRIDHQDVVYRTAREKFNVIAEEIAVRQKRNQPVLVGTVSVEKSELLSSLLKKKNIPHEILNAKNHAREATIIKNAGQAGNVTISTNMAGRGTDIVLGQGVIEAGGLCVIGTERHESRRIDNQLRGRSGRQGDPGESKFFLSLEDDLMRIFAPDKMSSIMGRLGMKEGEAIVSPLITRAIERAQKRVEEFNFSSRKHLLEYDDVMNQQRQVVYGRRRQLLDGNSGVDFIPDVVNSIAINLVEGLSPERTNSNTWDMEKVLNVLQTEFGCEISVDGLDLVDSSVEGIAGVVSEQVMAKYNEKRAMVGERQMNQVECFIYLQIIDSSWKDHLLSMDQLKDSVSLRGYGQRDPLQEYKKEAFRLFSEMMVRMEESSTLALIRMPPPTYAPPPPAENYDEEALSMQHPDTQGSSAGDSVVESLIGKRKADPTESRLNYQHGASGGNSASKKDQQPYKRSTDKVGRNDLCPCGSGKKYKKCHGKSDGNATIST